MKSFYFNLLAGASLLGAVALTFSAQADENDNCAQSSALSPARPAYKADTNSGNSIRVVQIPPAVVLDLFEGVDLSDRKPRVIEDLSPILHATEAEQLEFLTEHAYRLGQLMSDNIIPSIARTSNIDEAMFTLLSINPLVSLLPGAVVRKYLTQYLEIMGSLQRLEDKYNRQNKIEDRTFGQALDAIFSNKYFGLPPETPEEREQYFLERHLSHLSQPILDSVFTAAKRILKATKSNDNIVIFGNTPYYVGRALQMLTENSEIKRNIIIFPFSGTPNRQRPNCMVDTNNIVTSENLAHLIKRLRGHELMADNPELVTKGTYFVDAIASGGGPAYTIETILRDFQEQGVTQMPNFRIINLGEFKFSDNDLRHQQIAYTEARDGEELTLGFPSKRELHFEIPAQVIYMKTDLFDNYLDRYPSLRILPSYNAAFWRDEFDHILTAEHTILQQLLLEHFDVNIRDRIKKEAQL